MRMDWTVGGSWWSVEDFQKADCAGRGTDLIARKVKNRDAPRLKDRDTKRRVNQCLLRAKRDSKWYGRTWCSSCVTGSSNWFNPRVCYLCVCVYIYIYRAYTKEWCVSNVKAIYTGHIQKNGAFQTWKLVVTAPFFCVCPIYIYIYIYIYMVLTKWVYSSYITHCTIELLYCSDLRSSGILRSAEW
jgi:hypothetical protein